MKRLMFYALMLVVVVVLMAGGEKKKVPNPPNCFDSGGKWYVMWVAR